MMAYVTSPSKLPRFTFTDLARAVRTDTIADNGTSRNIATGRAPEHGFMVALPDHEEIMPWPFFSSPAGAAHLATYVLRRVNFLTKNSRSLYLGTWINIQAPDYTTDHRGPVYVDISVNVPNGEHARSLGKRYNQKAVWDVRGQRSILL